MLQFPQNAAPSSGNDTKEDLFRLASKRQQQAQETKNKLLQTAVRLISERGFEAVSINDITSECGVASGTFYLYFKSKDELALYLSNQIHDEIRMLLDQSGEAPALFLLRQILLLWKRWYDRKDPKLMARTNIVYADLYLSGQDHPNRNDARFETDTFRFCLKRAVEQGTLVPSTPVDFLAEMLAMTVHGMSSYYSYTYSQEAIDIWWEQFLHYVTEELLHPYRCT